MYAVWLITVGYAALPYATAIQNRQEPCFIITRDMLHIQSDHNRQYENLKLVSSLHKHLHAAFIDDMLQANYAGRECHLLRIHVTVFYEIFAVHTRNGSSASGNYTSLVFMVSCNFFRLQLIVNFFFNNHLTACFRIHSMYCRYRIRFIFCTRCVPLMSNPPCHKFELFIFNFKYVISLLFL